MPDELPITVPTNRVAQDYREAYAWLRWRSWGWPSVVVLLAAMSFWKFWVGGLASLPVVALWAVLAAGLYFWGLSRIASRMQEAHKKTGATSYTFSRDGFDYQSSVSQSHTSWSAVDRAAETRRSFLLIYANTCFLIIPKRCVPEERLPELRNLMRTSLGSRARLA